MKSIQFWVALLAAFGCMLSSCIVDSSFKIRSFVQLYIKPDSVYLERNDVGVVLISCKTSTETLAWYSKGDDGVMYDSLCRKHEDMSFNRKFWTVGAGRI